MWPRACSRVCVAQSGLRCSFGKSFLYCTLICREIDTELTHARAVIEALGGSPTSTELWLKLVEGNDLWTEAMRMQYELWVAAKSVGFTREQWQALKRGDSQQCGLPRNDN